MSSTDRKFFTNDDDIKLLDRFKVALENTKYFYVLVGYFRSSGFFKLCDKLQNIEKIKILVGINIDKLSYDIVEKYSKDIEKEFEDSDDTKETEQGVKMFIKLIQEKKLEIRAYRTNIHAKVYIMIKKDGENYGSVITGSSNFSVSGLEKNIEFNVELKDKPDVDFAKDWFEKLWEKSIDVTDKYIETINNKTYFNDQIKPYDLYLKFIYEYFIDRINDDKKKLSDSKVPNGFIKLEYQQEAVKDALNKLQKHNGVIIADVVGLGKTYICALLAQQLKGQKLKSGKLIICPPHLKNYWEDTFRDFDVTCKVESIGKIDKIVENQKYYEDYEYVFIDEAHRFRNYITQSFQNITTICKGKKVILVTATPFNNDFDDLKSLISLFQNMKNSTIPNKKDLEGYFAKIKKELNNQENNQNYDLIKKKAEEVRDNVLRHIMIRRTRKEIEKYFGEDMQKQGISFPVVEEPKKIVYELDTDLNKLFDDTLEIITKKLKYARYIPAMYLNKSVDEKQKTSQQNIKGFMKVLLLKRLESSFEAFRKSIERMIRSYQGFLKMYENGTIYISKKIDIYDLIENDNFDKIVELLEKENVIKYEKKDINPNFEKDMKDDIDLLGSLLDRWVKISYDPKFEELSKLLEGDLKNKQIILFSESKETVEYLETKLIEKGFDKILSYSSQSSETKKQQIKDNFDPVFEKSNNIKILLTTDVLAEGINLHKSNIIINYDIPWNPTRVLQRVGRVNRVGTKHKNIFIYNFFPTEKSDKAISLEDKIKAKMSAFINLLGTDAKYLTESEEIQSHVLFDKINSKVFLNSEDFENIEKSELKYLKIIRQIRDNNPDLFQRIKLLPKKSRTGRKHENYNGALLTFFRKGDVLKMYISSVSSDIKTKEISFDETIKILECDENEPKQNIDIEKYYNLLDKNKSQFNNSLGENNEPLVKSRQGNKNYILKCIRSLLSNKTIVDQEEKFFKKLEEEINNGKITYHTLNKIKHIIEENGCNNPSNLYYKLKDVAGNHISNDVSEHSNNTEKNLEDDKIEVILNEYLI